MVEMLDTFINDRWHMKLPKHRAERFEADGTSLWPTWEKERIAAMADTIAEGDTVLDIGTEEGDISSLLQQWVGETGKLFLFEPNVKVWPNIKAIWTANELPMPAGYWIGFAAEEDDFEEVDMSNAWPPCAYDAVIGNHGFLQLTAEERSVPRITIDTFCVMHNIYPNVITMDVEGAEFSVLKGAKQVLINNDPVVFVSIHPEPLEELYDTTKQELLSWMGDLGYWAEHLATDHEEHYAFVK